MAVGFAAAVFAFAGTARAVDNPASCTNDIDCIATPNCGGDLCDWDNGLKCGAVTAANKGWCMADTDCKCHAQGATCDMTIHHCTKVTSSTGSAGTTGSAGSGSGGSGSAGTTGTAGSGTTSSGSSGGCSVATSTSGGLGALVGLALVAGRIVRRRRRA
jgi:MYXO-CTERM domain-containing protein